MSFHKSPQVRLPTFGFQIEQMDHGLGTSHPIYKERSFLLLQIYPGKPEFMRLQKSSNYRLSGMNRTCWPVSSIGPNIEICPSVGNYFIILYTCIDVDVSWVSSVLWHHQNLIYTGLLVILRAQSLQLFLQE